ncbi:MAG: hypothetical protein WKG00_34290 [Polyangiaceae bacterium]
MELNTPPADVARLGLRAMKTIAAADGEIYDLERRFAIAVQRHILGTDLDFDALQPVGPDELDKGIPAAFRERIVHACLVAALIDGEASAPELALLDAFARALGVPRDAIATVKLVDEHLLRFRTDIQRSTQRREVCRARAIRDTLSPSSFASSAANRAA